MGVDEDIGKMLSVIKSGSLSGLPVICAKTGKKMGVIVDIEFKPGRKKIEVIVLSGYGLVERKRYIPLEQIRTIGKHAVIVELPQSPSESKSPGFFNRARGIYGNHIVGYQLVRGDGQELGQISDIILNPNDGSVEGYEVSKGIIEDIIEGRSILPYDALNSVSNDAVIVSIEQTDQLQPYNKGIKGMLEAERN